MTDQEFQERVLAWIDHSQNWMERTEEWKTQTDNRLDNFEGRMDRFEERMGTLQEGIAWIRGKINGRNATVKCCPMGQDRCLGSSRVHNHRGPRVL